ncbi:MAG TPA: glutathione S-transferase family protein [Rhizomicrobium sp.]|jgi:glutathione S-transferase|nr:glutathione S-transferase family protein [Rhizomicrobium sp.]
MSLDNAAMTIYGDSISGNCLKVKFVADRLGIAYDWVEISVINKETRTPEFLAMNPAGQVPVVRFAGSGTLAQSNAIILHLAENTDLIPADAFERAQMFQWLFWEQYSHETALAVLRFQKFYLKKPDHEIDPNLRPRCLRVLSLMEEHLEGDLEGRDYFVGGKLSLADVALVAYTRFSHQADIDLKQYPNVAAWVRRVEHDLKIEHLQ